MAGDNVLSTKKQPWTHTQRLDREEHEGLAVILTSSQMQSVISNNIYMWVCGCVCVCMCVYVCMYACKKERERGPSIVKRNNSPFS